MQRFKETGNVESRSEPEGVPRVVPDVWCLWFYLRKVGGATDAQTQTLLV